LSFLTNVLDIDKKEEWKSPPFKPRHGSGSFQRFRNPAEIAGLWRTPMEIRKIFRLAATVLGLSFFLVSVWSCEGKIRYRKEDLKRFEEKKAGVELQFRTRYGHQSAFYLFPQQDGRKIPARLVIAYPGITALALGWLDFLSDASYPDTGFLLIDYPGRGNSQGTFRPTHLDEASSGALEALANCLGTSTQALTGNMVFFGHSFGCAAALQFAVKAPPKRIVVVAPFNTFREAAFRRIGPLAWIIPGNLDNCERIKDLCRLPSPPEIIIFHGSADETLPVSMGRDLAGCSPGCVQYHEIEEAGHTSILHSAHEAILTALLSP
jgi:hypothetical protein